MRDFHQVLNLSSDLEPKYAASFVKLTFELFIVMGDRYHAFIISELRIIQYVH